MNDPTDNTSTELRGEDLDRFERWADRHDAHVLMRTDDVLALVAEVRRLRGFVDDCLFGFEGPNGGLTTANLDVLRDRAIALAGNR